MPSDEPFPLYFVGDARQGLVSEALRRMAIAAHLGNNSRVLDLGGQGHAALLLAREFGCSVIAADAEGSDLDLLRRQVRARSLDHRLEIAKVDYSQLSFPEGEFHLILAPSYTVFPLAKAMQKLRRHLAPKGKLLVCHPVRVGRVPESPVVQLWEKRLSERLPLPRDVLQTFAASGFEPESIESLSDAQLEDFHRALEQHANEKAPHDAGRAASLREQIQVHRSQVGKATVSYATAVGRRKEPGEKPAASRDRG